LTRIRGFFAPEPRSIILHITEFGTINILGLDLSEARNGNIVVKITHNAIEIKD